MKFFERGPKPQANIDAERNLADALNRQSQLTSELRYSELRNGQVMPLIREQAQLEVALELEARKLEGVRLEAREADEESSYQDTMEQLRKERAELRGEVYVAQQSSRPRTRDLAAAEAAYQTIKARLDLVRAQIKDRSAALRSQLGLPPQ